MHTDTHTGLEILIQLQPGVLFRLASQTAHSSPHRSQDYFGAAASSFYWVK